MQHSAESHKGMRVVQILPALDSGGVERGTVEFAREMVKRGHESIVISNGGRMVEQLEREGSRHITLPVHKKSLWSLRMVRPLRKLFAELNADIVHVRSRAPAWLAFLAWRKMPKSTRPHLVSTVHGLYSINAYSAVMTKAEHIIAISDCVQEYITSNYGISPNKITRIYRGLDPATFTDAATNREHANQLLEQFPQFQGKKLLLMPGRLTRWKGQEAFLEMMKHLCDLRDDCHGVIVGAAEENKQHYLKELEDKCSALGLNNKVTFAGHRSDIESFYQLADITCHMSQHAEPFGRTVPEALACGCPVVAYDRGGASESLREAFPEGLVEADNIKAFAKQANKLLDQPEHTIALPKDFYLENQVEQTLSVYRQLIESASLD